MGAINKLIAEIGGKPLVRIAAEQALASRAAPVIVVTGHERAQVLAHLGEVCVGRVCESLGRRPRAHKEDDVERPRLEPVEVAFRNAQHGANHHGR